MAPRRKSAAAPVSPQHASAASQPPQPPPGAVLQDFRDGRLEQEWQLVVAGSRSRSSSRSAGLQSSSSSGKHRKQGSDRASRGLRHALLAAFMPVGYPDSVTPDYAGFVAWNTLQALSSYVRGVLSSHAVFKGVGVGSEAATALGAVFQFFVRDCLGMAGGILFATAAGSNFDANAKQWRLFADCMNDVAMALDLASPLIPGCFMLLASAGSVARAMVGMSAGATGAALTQHFAAGSRSGGWQRQQASSNSNAADISAKADSRERATSIIGSLLGMAVTRHLADHLLAGWVFFALLTWLHVWANMRCLRRLVLRSLNTPRLRLLLSHYTMHGEVLSPQQVSGLESLVVPPLAALLGALRCSGSSSSCSIKFGARLSTALSAAAEAAADGAAGRDSSSSRRGRSKQQHASEAGVLQAVLAQQQAAARRQYMLLLTGSKAVVIHVVLHASADQAVQLAAYAQALHLQAALEHRKVPCDAAQRAELLADSQAWVGQQLPAFMARLAERGWQPECAYLPAPTYTAGW